MTKVDQFESVFRAAAKQLFEYEPYRAQKALVVTDLERAEAEELGARLRAFLSVLEAERPLEWRHVSGDEFRSVGDLLRLVADCKPDLICTYRHLHSDAWTWPHSLGEGLDVLTQATQVPVLVVPHPKAARGHIHALENTDVVMAITDHLTGDHQLVNAAAGFAEKDGTLFLTHIEDELLFTRLIETISKIPEIDTDTAREEIRTHLLAEPYDYVRSCQHILQRERPELRIDDLVVMGHRLKDYRELIDQHEVDLLIFRTKDDDQLAMKGMAYPLAVDLREIPLLML